MSALALQPGSELDRGKYRIVRLLGKGGMGVVYEAEHTVTHGRVAIKCMHPAVASGSGRARLIREAQAAERVRHRNAVRVYDVGEDGETIFLVMEYLEGESLTTLLERDDVPVHQVIALLLPAMRAVASGHRKGVIHRDIKPDNIFLAREEDCDEVVPKVLDFGISKVDFRDLPHESLTRDGGALGTPRYMSYEQLSGERDLDGRADVYAFGVILYEALTGHPPFGATSFSALICQVATQVPSPPKSLRAEIPSVLAALVMWALARDRADRLPSIADFIRELEPFATERGFRSEMTGDHSPLVALPGERVESEIRKVPASSPASAATPAKAQAPARGRSAKIGAAIAVSLLVGGVALVWPRSEQVEPAVPSLPRVPTAEEPSSVLAVQSGPSVVGDSKPDGTGPQPASGKSETSARTEAAAAPDAGTSIASSKPVDKRVRRTGPKGKVAATSDAATSRTATLDVVSTSATPPLPEAQVTGSRSSEVVPADDGENLPLHRSDLEKPRVPVPDSREF